MGLFVKYRIEHLPISVLFLILCSSLLTCMSEGRELLHTLGHSKAGVDKEKTILNSQIGSRPPRCERSCSSCGHCEAIQVPTNPQVKLSGLTNSSVISKVGDYGSNYKPMSWKCKCGNFIFNP